MTNEYLKDVKHLNIESIKNAFAMQASICLIKYFYENWTGKDIVQDILHTNNILDYVKYIINSDKSNHTFDKDLADYMDLLYMIRTQTAGLIIQTIDTPPNDIFEQIKSDASFGIIKDMPVLNNTIN